MAHRLDMTVPRVLRINQVFWPLDSDCLSLTTRSVRTPRHDYNMATVLHPWNAEKREPRIIDDGRSGLTPRLLWEERLYPRLVTGHPVNRIVV